MLRRRRRNRRLGFLVVYNTQAEVKPTKKEHCFSFVWERRGLGIERPERKERNEIVDITHSTIDRYCRK